MVIGPIGGFEYGEEDFSRGSTHPCRERALMASSSGHGLPLGGPGEHPDALPKLTVHDEVVIECDAEAASGVAEWISTTLRGAVADVLGYEELAGEDAVETSIIEAWGDG